VLKGFLSKPAQATPRYTYDEEHRRVRELLLNLIEEIEKREVLEHRRVWQFEKALKEHEAAKEKR